MFILFSINSSPKNRTFYFIWPQYFFFAFYINRINSSQTTFSKFRKIVSYFFQRLKAAYFLFARYIGFFVLSMIFFVLIGNEGDFSGFLTFDMMNFLILNFFVWEEFAFFRLIHSDNMCFGWKILHGLFDKLLRKFI